MFQTKLDVDRHVENSLKKVNSENERILRYFAFAKLYYRVGENELARRYVTTYLTIKPHSAEGQHLLGNALEKMGKKDAALQAYRSSLDIDPKQNRLVLKVCELLASDDVTLEPSAAHYWCEQAQSIAPHDPIVFSLRERLIASESKDPNDVQKLLLSELEARPFDVNLRIRLLRHYLQHNQIKSAYVHVSDVERKVLPTFVNSLKWYETVADVLIRYKRENTHNDVLTWDFWILIVTVLDRLTTHTLDENSTNVKNWSDCVNSVFNTDQMLYVASQNVAKCTEGQLVQEFLQHYRAQLCFHFCVLIFKQAKKELIKYKDAGNLSLPLLFASYHSPPVELQAMWLGHSTEDQRQQVQSWHREGAFRCSQAGHVLLAAVKERKNTFLERAIQMCSGVWREQLYKRIFVTRDQQSKIKTSYFVTCSELIEITVRLPEPMNLLHYDETAQLIYPESLHHYVWIALNYRPLSKFRFTIFDGLQYSVRNLSNCSADTLNKLDVLSFIFCSTLCARSQIDEARNQIYYNQDRPNVIPVAVTETLGTYNQSKWIASVYKVYKNDCGTDLTELRLTLIRGIEVIRCVGHHGLDVKLLVCLANAFAERAKQLTKQSEIEFNEARADMYWKTALPLLERMKNNQAISYMSNRLFEYKGKTMSMTEVISNVDDGKLFSAMQLMKKKEYEKANQIFESLKNPYASFYQAQIYKQLADEQMSQHKENVTSEMRSQNIILLSRARDCFYLTLDRLREPAVDRKHPLNAELGTEIEKIERLLSRIDPDVTNRNECDGMSDENLSSTGSTGDHNLISSYIPHGSYLNGNVTPSRNFHSSNLQSTPFRSGEFPLNFSSARRTEARPSPERLDAQLRQMAASKDAAITFVLEEHRSLKEALTHLQSTVDELEAPMNETKSIKKAVDELVLQLKDFVLDVKNIKSSAAEWRDDIKTMKDMFYDMKKELTEVKKDTNKLKSSQLSEEDLYALDEEYAGDYSVNAGVAAGFNQASLYQAFPPKIQQSGNMNPYGTPAIPFPGMYAMYPYSGLGLSMGQPGLSFPEGQISDFRALGLTQPGLLPNQTLPTVPMANMFAKTPADITGAYPRQHDVPVPLPAVVPSQMAQPIPSAIVSQPIVRAAPVNVVITASDPLPTTSVTPPPLSVIIPPQHLKGNMPPKMQVHNYQIPLPSTSFPTFTNASAIASQPPLPVTTSTLLSNVAPPVFSSIASTRTIPPTPQGLGLQIEKSLSQSFNPNVSLDESKIESNKSNASNASLDDHDPCPDFKPIVPLPDEVPLNTGEEGETVLFCEKAKLFRHVNKEWKERGTGILKLLYDKATGKVRVLMRRDQVFKICANHNLTKDMQLKPMPKTDKAYMWAANDFAEEEFKLETLCVRFKTCEEAQKFLIAFERSKDMIVDTPNTSVAEIETVQQKTQLDSIKDVTNVGGSPDKSQLGVATLGGFVFNTPPAFKPKDPLPAAEVAAAQPTQQPATNAFASFSFGSKPIEVKQSVVFGGSGGDFKPVGNPFASPNVSTDLFGSPKPITTKPVAETPKLVTAKPVAKSPKAVDEGSAEEFIPTAEFVPVVPLPNLVDIKTGEENAEVLFESRAKLLCYDVVNKEWKERGVGDMKILKEDVIRLVMRREQVLKVCCNHVLLKNMDFNKLPNTNKALSWYAQDYSENVMKGELFAIRFRSQVLCNSFAEAIADAKAMLDRNNKVIDHVSSSSSSDSGDDKETSPKKQQLKFCTDDGLQTNSTPTANTTGWGDKFKPKSGNWECKTCYIQNEAKNNYCEACDTPKNDTVPKKTTNDSGQQFSFGMPLTNSSFSFGSPQTQLSAAVPAANNFTTVVSKPDSTGTVVSNWGDAFKPKVGSWECKICYISNAGDKQYCVACESPMDDTIPKKETASTIKGINLDTPGQTFTFGMPSVAKDAATNVGGTPTSNTIKTNFTFGDSQNKVNTGFTFGGTPKLNPETSVLLNLSGKPDFSFNQSGDDSFVFGSPMKHDFEFKPRSPRVSTGTVEAEESEGSFVEDEGDHIVFKPVIPLPDKVDVITGEEHEDVLYCHRAKLFRFVGEWKERGIGDIKVLKNKDNGKLRVVMRREQILKICLNHVLSKDVDYIPKDEKTWLFTAADYSEGELVHQQFCLRFKNGDIAQEFKKAVDDAVKNIPISLDKSQDDTTDDSDVEIVSELKVSAEDEQKALALQLPRNFYAYLQKPSCPGCPGCEPDDEPTKQSNEFTCSSGTKPISDSILTNQTKLGSVQSPSSSSSFTWPQTQSETLKSLIEKPSLFAASSFNSPNAYSTVGSNATTPSPSLLFSTPKNETAKVDTPTTKPDNIFGGNGSVFGGNSIFGGAKTTNMFGSPLQQTTPVFGSKTTATLFGGTDSNLFAPKSSTQNVTPTITNKNEFSFTTQVITNTTTTTSSSFSFASTRTTAATTTTASSSSPFTPKSASTTTTSIFSNPPTPISSGSLFGTDSSTNKSIFGGPTVFGGTGIFGGPAPPIASVEKKTIFGSGSASQNSIFGAPVVADNKTPKQKDEAAVPKMDSNLSFASLADVTGSSPLLNCDSKLSFASLAANTGPTPAFGQPDATPKMKPFMFDGCGTPVFGSKTTPKSAQKTKDKPKTDGGSADEDGDEEGAAADGDYDPHYEPVIPLPDAIVVSTGEEDESPKFNERAKLFRWDDDNKEWKERGVGQMKILHNPTTGTYRFLLRREQVHKVVLNQLIKHDLELQPMNTSDKAWLWCGYNYTDDGSSLEKLAIKFKNTELAQQFNSSVQECKTNIQHYQQEQEQHHNVSQQVEQDYEGVSGEEYENDEDDTSTLFIKRCCLSSKADDGTWINLGMGEIRMFYDGYIYTSRISVTSDSGEVLTCGIISTDTIMEIDGRNCEWNAVDSLKNYPQNRTLRATFSSIQAAEECHVNYTEAMEYAQQAEENMDDIHSDEEED